MKKLVALLLTFLLIVTGCNTVEVTKVEDDNKTDAVRFHNEYKKVSKNNVYEYSTYDNVIDTIENGTGVIYLGFPSCVLCKEITPILNDAAKEKKLDKVLYYNFKDIRDNNTLEYQKLENILLEYILKEDDKTKETKITAPTVIFVKEGNIKGIYIGIINGKSEEIITEEEKESLKDSFLSLIEKLSEIEETKEVEE